MDSDTISLLDRRRIIRAAHGLAQRLDQRNTRHESGRAQTNITTTGWAAGANGMSSSAMNVQGELRGKDSISACHGSLDLYRGTQHALRRNLLNLDAL
jgi:hypothetical protein